MNTETKAPNVVVEHTTEAANELAASKAPNQKELDGVNAKLAKATTWTPEENACIDGLQSKLGITRREAMVRLRTGQKKGHSADRILAEAIAPKPAAKAKAPTPTAKAAQKLEMKREPKAAKGAKTERYDRELVIRLFERDNMTATEIAGAVDKYAGLRKGNKKISAVYVGRILWGQENSGGVSDEQKKRRKLRDEREAKAKKESEDK